MHALCRWIAGIGLLTIVCWFPCYLILASAFATEGWEMASVDTQMLAELERSPSLEEFLARYGFSTDDDIDAQLSLIGKPDGLTLQGEQNRFLFVADERMLSSPFGTLIVFDRTAGEELLQVQSARNIAIIASLASAALLVVGALGTGLTTRRRDLTDPPPAS